MLILLKSCLYNYIKQYINTQFKMDVQCDKGHQSFSNFKNHNRRCPIESTSSKGEQQVANQI